VSGQNLAALGQIDRIVVKVENNGGTDAYYRQLFAAMRYGTRPKRLIRRLRGREEVRQQRSQRQTASRSQCTAA